MDYPLSGPALPATTDLLSWFVEFELHDDFEAGIELVIKEQALIGMDDESPISERLAKLPSRELGISRRHAYLRVENSALYIIDLNSTNKTQVNGRVIEPGEPFPLADGDVITFGRLEVTLRVRQGFRGRSKPADLPDNFPLVLAQLAKSLAGQLALDDILETLLQGAIDLVNAQQVAVWLLDPYSDTLMLEAQIGIEDEGLQRARLPVTNPLVKAAFVTGQPVRGSRRSEGEAIKIKTGYLVEAVLYVPLINNGVKLGVLAATKQVHGAEFNQRDEAILETMSDFAAVAISNARMYEQIKRADQLKQELIQNISHEFRTPLAYIIGYVGLFAHDDASDIPENVREQMKAVEEQANRIKWLLDNFQTLTAENTQTYNRQILNPQVVVERAASSIASKMADRSQQLSTEVRTDIHVRGDEAAIIRVLDNLLSNASKFSPPESEIWLTVQYDEQLQQVIVTVRDEGVGIDPVHHQRVFEPFFQVDGSVTRHFSGVGLGLTASRNIIEQHGGEIWVDSALGEGTSILFTLPPYVEEA